MLKEKDMTITTTEQLIQKSYPTIRSLYDEEKIVKKYLDWLGCKPWALTSHDLQLECLGDQSTVAGLIGLIVLSEIQMDDYAHALSIRYGCTILNNM